MNDPTVKIDTILYNTDGFTVQDIKCVIAFVNELSENSLDQIENGSERDIMYSFERLLQATQNGTQRSQEQGYELQMLNYQQNTTIPENSRSFYQRYSTRNPFLGGSIYNNTLNSVFDYAGKVLTAVSGLTGGVGLYLSAGRSAEEMEENANVRYTLYALGISGVVAGLLVMLRPHLSTKKMEKNKELLEVTKKVAKARTTLREFFSTARNKIITGEETCREKAILLLQRHMPAPVIEAQSGQRERVMKFLFDELPSAATSFKAKIFPDSHDQYVLFDDGHREQRLSRADMKLMYEIASVF